jgi:hypothetical protein
MAVGAAPKYHFCQVGVNIMMHVYLRCTSMTASPSRAGCTPADAGCNCSVAACIALVPPLISLVVSHHRSTTQHHSYCCCQRLAVEVHN